MNFKEFYYKDFRPSYLEGVVRYPEQTDYVIEQNCKPINGKDLSEIGLSDLNNIIKICDDTYCIDRVKKLRSVLKRIMRYAYACRYTSIDLSAFELRRCRKRPETVQQLSFTAEQAAFLTSGDSIIMKMFRFECLTGLRRDGYSTAPRHRPGRPPSRVHRGCPKRRSALRRSPGRSARRGGTVCRDTACRRAGSDSRLYRQAESAPGPAGFHR